MSRYGLSVFGFLRNLSEIGKLPPQLHNQVQEICAQSIERHQAYFWERANQGQPLNNVEPSAALCRLRVPRAKTHGPTVRAEYEW